MRTPDQPGKFRVRQVGGEWKLTGLRKDGRRVKMAFSSDVEARDVASKLFPVVAESVNLHVVPAVNSQLDDWGLPIQIDESTVASVGEAMGIKPPEAVTDSTVVNENEIKVDPEQEKKVRENRARAKGLCELLGIGWATGDVYLGKWLTRTLGKEPVNADPKQVSRLADAARDTMVDLIGERELKPWQLMILLTLALPTSMMLQSPRKPKELPADSPQSSTDLPMKAPLQSVKS